MSCFLVGSLVGGVGIPLLPLRVGPLPPPLPPLPPLPPPLSLPLPPYCLNFQKLMHRHVQVDIVAKIRVIKTDINNDDRNPSGDCRDRIECTTLGHEKWQIAKYSVIGMLCPDLRTSFSDEVSLKVA
jgi:hypothetical protein